jgi:hypothetical protein
MANTTLQIRHSTVAGNTPSSLANGEIAINSRDGVLYYSTPTGTVTAFNSSTGPAGLNKEIQFNDSGSLGGSEKLTFDKATGELVVNGTVRANIFSDDGIDLYDFSNRAFTTANAAFNAANTSSGSAGAFNQANSAFIQANAAFAAANSVSSATVAVFETTSNGTVSSFDIGFNPVSKEAVMVTIAGIVQPVSVYSVNSSANTITFTENPANNELVRVASFYTNASVTYFQSLPAPVTPSIFEATANGSVSSFDIGFNPGTAASVLVSIGGVVQPTSAYTVNANANTITFITEGPASGEILRVVSFYSATNAYVINDASVSFAKFDSNVASTIINTQIRTNAAFDAANSAVAATTDTYARNRVNATSAVANSASNTALAAFFKANAAFISVNAAFDFANTNNTNIELAWYNANSAWNHANAAYDTANSTSGSAGAYHHANAAFDKANTAFINAAGLDGINNTQNNSIAAAFTAANSAANSTTDITARNTANAAFTKANNALANTTGATFGGELNITGTLRALSQGGDEGGELYLDKPVTNTVLNGGVTIDIYQNKLRFFETGGAIRGAFIDFSTAGGGIANNLLAGGSTDTYARNHANAAFITANAGGAVSDTYARNHANAAFTSANSSATNLIYAWNTANASFSTGNINIGYAWNHANAAFAAANAGGAGVDSYSRNTANAAFNHANAAFATANAGGGGGTTDVFARNQSNAAFDKANTGASPARTTVSATTASLASNATGNLTVTMAKGYGLYKIAVSTGAWVTVYGNIARRNADFTRSITTDPAPGSGVIAEAITTGTTANVTNFTPSVMGYNDDVSVTTNAYIKVYNNSGTTNTVTVTVTYLPLEV